MEVRHLVTQTSDLSDLYPTDFIIDLAGKMAEWQGFAILPFVDPNRILEAVRQLPPFTPDRVAVYNPKVNLVVSRDRDTEELVQARRRIMQLARLPERQRKEFSHRNFTQTGRQIANPGRRSMTKAERIAKWKAMAPLI